MNCTICEQPINPTDVFYGDGDGTGQRFAHYHCYNRRENNRQLNHQDPMTTRHDADWTTQTTDAPAAPFWWLTCDYEYADAEAARQDATAPYEVPRCAADYAAERRVMDARLASARWMMEQVEKALQRPYAGR